MDKEGERSIREALKTHRSLTELTIIGETDQ